MTQPTDAHDRYDLATTGENVLDDLGDVIFNISPTETPFQSNIGRETSSSDYKEWFIDSLAAATAGNAHFDGDDFTADALNAAERLGNYHQIARKDLVVTRRADKVSKAGRKKELAYQIAKAGKELKRDVESSLVAEKIAVVGNSSTAPITAGLGGWLATNISRGTSGTAPALSSTTYGYPDTLGTDGTNRALDESAILGVIKDCYVAGGDPNMIMVGPAAKQQFSLYMFGSSARIATPYQDHGAGKKNGVNAIGAVDVYVSDFGALDIVPNRFQGEDDCFILDTEYWCVSYLDSYKVDKIAKSGDSEKRMLLVDFALVSKNEAASGWFADVDETTAMVA